MRRRTVLKLGVGAAVTTLTTGCPFDGVTKAKAVRVVGFVIDLAKESLPLLNLLGAREIADTVEAKAIPALGKLRDALANADIPSSRTTLETVRNVLNGVETALLKLPESPRVTTLIGILASINLLLLTVESFIESEMGGDADPGTSALGAPKSSEKMRRILEATRQ